MRYDSKPIFKPKKTTLETSQSSSTNFISSYTTKSHLYMVWVLRIHSSNIDNEEVNKLATLKKVLAQYD